MGRLIENGMKLTSIGASRGNETINSISLMINEIVELICFHWTLKATPLFDEWEEIGFVFMSCSLPPAALIKVRNEGRKTRIVLMSEWPAAGGQRESSKLHFIQFISLWEWEMKEWNWIVCLRGLACFFLFINCVDWKEKWRGWVGLLSWIVGYGRSSANAPQWKENEDKQLNQ